MPGDAPLDLRCMVEAEPQLDAKALPGGLRFLVEQEQGMAVDDFLDATGAAVPLDPGLQELARLLGPALLLVEEAVIVVIVLRSGDELLQRLGAVEGERETFVE